MISAIALRTWCCRYKKGLERVIILFGWLLGIWITYQMYDTSREIEDHLVIELARQGMCESEAIKQDIVMGLVISKNAARRITRLCDHERDLANRVAGKAHLLAEIEGLHKRQ